jgi:ferredoxin-NADP reductase
MAPTATANATALVKRELVAEGTMAFYFDRPPGFQFRAGQSIDVTLNNPPETDAEGNIRTFSIASAPFESYLMACTRMRNTAFKRVLGKMPLGTQVKIDGPGGSFNLHKNTAKPAVFLAGGIGITPFLSILRQADHEHLAHQLYLFYSNRRPEDTPFLDGLRELSKSNPNFHLVLTMTEMSKSARPWSGETGFINREMLSKYVPNLQGPIYYIAGPPGMVTAMRQSLTQAAVDEDDIRTEEFAGY